MEKLGLKERLYDIEGSFNVRDLGGYPGHGGRIVRPRRFIRSGSLANLTPKGRQALLDLGIRCVVDLRSQQEAKAMPDRIGEDGAFRCHHMPMLDYMNLDAAAGSMELPATIEQMYMDMLAQATESFGRLFALFAEPGCDGYLFHCTAGKDRTGMTAMLLLSLAGVSEEDIVEDYSHSEQLLPDMGRGPSHLRTSNPHTLERILRHMEHRYGGPLGYLEKVGVTKKQRDAVIAKLLNE